MARTRASTLEFVNEIFPTGMVFSWCFYFVSGTLDSLARVAVIELSLPPAPVCYEIMSRDTFVFLDNAEY